MIHPTLIGIRHDVLVLARPSGHAAKCFWWSCGSDSCYRQPHPPEACCPTGSLHMSSGLDDADKEFEWKEGWPETLNNQLLSRGYHAYRHTGKRLFTANHRRFRFELTQRWQNLTMAHWQPIIFGDESRFQLYPVDGRLRVCCLPGERFQQRCQAYRV